MTNDTRHDDDEGVETVTPDELETILAEQLDDLAARAAGIAPADADDLKTVADFGKATHRVAVNIDENLYAARRVRDGDVPDDAPGTDRTTAELDDHIDALTALRERLAAVVADAPVDVTVETAAGATETTASALGGIWKPRWTSAYAAVGDALPVPVERDDDAHVED